MCCGVYIISKVYKKTITKVMWLIEIMIQSLFIGIVGLYSRFFFYKLIGKEKSLSYLRGNNLDEIKSDAQNFYNAIVGLCVGSIVIILAAYLIFT